MAARASLVLRLGSSSTKERLAAQECDRVHNQGRVGWIFGHSVDSRVAVLAPDARARAQHDKSDFATLYVRPDCDPLSIPGRAEPDERER
jgi:hypothetical protein